MNTSKILEHLNDVSQFSKDSIHSLEVIANKYPYFQTAQLLLTKNLYFTDNDRFKSTLSVISAICADRKKLFYIINNEKYKIFIDRKDNLDNKERTDEILDSFLHGSTINNEPDNSLSSKETIVSTDYLSFIQHTDSNESVNNEDNPKNNLKHQDIIDSFLEKAESNEISIQHQQKESRKATKPDISPTENSILTETLARIYIKQKKYEQALTIIQQLSLNFPKKSAYFADQIRFLELLIHNEKNNKD